MNVDIWPDQDLVHAVVLPDLQDKHDDFFEKKTEFTEAQARQMDLAGLPILINHDEGLGCVGEAIAYAVRDKSVESKARAEVLFALTDPSTIDDERLRYRLHFQQNALMNGAHRDVSLAHSYDVALMPETSGFVAAATGADNQTAGQCVIRKNPFEISTCDEGKRTGSHVLAYLPSAKTLRSATEGAVRDFCAKHYFPEPPAGVTVKSPEWRAHIEYLVGEIAQRRRLLFKRDTTGVHRASSGTVDQLPWHFVNPDNVGMFNAGELARMFDLLLPPPPPPATAAQPPAAAPPVDLPAALPTTTDQPTAAAAAFMSVDPPAAAAASPLSVDPPSALPIDPIVSSQEYVRK